MNAISQNNGIYGNFNALYQGQGGVNANIEAISGDLGGVTQGALETSNVDLTQDTINQITAQSAVSANVQSIQTADSMLQTLLDIQA